MIFPYFENIDRGYLFGETSALSKLFAIMCQEVSGYAFPKEVFYSQIIGKDFSSLEPDSQFFGKIHKRITYSNSLREVATVFTDKANFPEKITKQSKDRIMIFKEAMETLASNEFLRSVVASYLLEKNKVKQQGWFSWKKSSKNKIMFCDEKTFYAIFSSTHSWDLSGAVGKFNLQDFKTLKLAALKRILEKHKISVNHCFFLLRNAITEKKLKYDAAKNYFKIISKMELSDAERYTINLFLWASVQLAKKGELKFDGSVRVASVRKTKEEKEQAKEKKLSLIDNPKFTPDERKIFYYWNSKNLRKHKNGNSNLVKDFIRFFRNRGQAHYKGKFTVEQVLGAIDKLELMANDPNVCPVDPAYKARYKRLGLNEFIFHKVRETSVLRDILEKGIETAVEIKNQSMFDKVVHVITTTTCADISTANKNIVAQFCNKMQNYLLENKHRVTSGYDTMTAELIKHIFETRRNFNYLFLLSEDMFLNYAKDFFEERGYMKKQRKAAPSYAALPQQTLMQYRQQYSTRGEE